MVELRDFEIGSGNQSLEDFKPEVTKKKNPINRASSVNKAANISLIGNPDNLEENFETVLAEMGAEGVSPTGDAITAEANRLVKERTTQSVYSILADPDLDDEDKLEAIRATEQGFQDLPAQTILSQESLVNAGEPDDSEEVEQARLNLVEYLDEMNERKAENQRIQNMLLAGQNPAVASKVFDLVEYLIPFSSFAEGEQLAKVMADYRKGEGLSEKEVLEKSHFLLANMKDDLKQMSAKMSPQERMEFSRRIVEILGDHPNLILPDGNDFSTAEILSIVQDPGSYTDVDWTLDMVFQGLDIVFGLGSAVKGIGKITKAGKTAKDVSDVSTEVVKVQNKTMKSEVKETSPSQIVKDTNPEAAKKLHKVASEAETDDLAQATHGASKSDAIANDVLPEIRNPDDSIRNKVHNVDELVETTPRNVNEQVMDMVSWKENNIYFDKEIELARSQIVNKFQDPVGLTVHDEMFVAYKNDAGNTVVQATYGPAKAGFKAPEEAIQHVEWSFRDYGITRESMDLYKRVGDEYVKTSIKEEQGIKALADEFRRKKKKIPEELKPAVDYKVAIKHEFELDPSNVDITKTFSTKNIFFDRATGGIFGTKIGTTITSNIVPPTSYLDPKLTAMSTNVVDRSAGLEAALAEMKDDFAKGFRKLKKEEQALVTSMIKEANAKSKDFTETWLRASGLKAEGRDLLRQWKSIWDTIHWIDNKDLVKSYRNQGYKMYENKTMGTRTPAKPLARNQLGDVVSVYDDTTDKVVKLNKVDLETLYGKDGTVAQLRRHMDVDGQKVAHIIVENVPTNGYLRALNEQDNVLAYRPGYYQVYYKDPIFVVIKEVDANGVEYERAVGTAGNSQDARHLIERLKSQNPDMEYDFRRDVKRKSEVDNMYLDIAQASGRSSQRRRGKRLEASDSNVLDPSQENILDPVQALTKSLTSMANRVSTREYFEVTKRRMMNQFKDVFPKDPKTQQTMWPTDASQIRATRGSLSNKTVIEAKVNWEYINHLENGWANLIDDSWKALMNFSAEEFERMGFSKLEGLALKATEGSGPTGAARGLAFNSYLALFPQRQILVQSGQALQLFANYKFSNVSQGFIDIQPLIWKLSNPDVPIPKNLQKAWKMTDAEATNLAREYKLSGFNAAVDINNMVRQNARFMDEHNNPILRAPGKALNFSRKLGFDAGEQINMMMTYLTVRRQKLDGGARALNNEELSEVMAEARNYSYNMNKAGDLSYNNSSASFFMQFAQVAHKYATNVLPESLGGNRRFTLSQKARIQALNTALFGVPSVAIAPLLAQLPDDTPEEVVDLVEYGGMSLALNSILSVGQDEKTRIDWTSFAPSEVHGFMDMLSEMMLDQSMLAIIAESPSGSLLFGKNARIAEAFKSAARLFHFIPDPAGDTNMLEVANEFAEISSGWSAAAKSIAAFKLNELNSRTGVPIDDQVTNPEAFFKAFGLSTIDEDQYWKSKIEVAKDKKKIEADIEEWYNDLSKQLNNRGMKPDELETIKKKYNSAWLVYGDVPYAYEYLKRLADRDAKNGVFTLYSYFLEAMEWQTFDKLKAQIMTSPLDAQAKENLISIARSMRDANG